jgi:hypothetical protein
MEIVHLWPPIFTGRDVAARYRQKRERVYNQIRPHQALDYWTPAEYIQKYHPLVTSPESHMY